MLPCPHASLELQRDEQSRLAAAEARGEARGKAMGESRGIALGILAGKIQTLQSILSDSQQSSDELVAMPEEALISLLASLQERIRSRG